MRTGRKQVAPRAANGANGYKSGDRLPTIDTSFEISYNEHLCPKKFQVHHLHHAAKIDKGERREGKSEGKGSSTCSIAGGSSSTGGDSSSSSSSPTAGAGGRHSRDLDGCVTTG